MSRKKHRSEVIVDSDEESSSSDEESTISTVTSDSSPSATQPPLPGDGDSTDYISQLLVSLTSWLEAQPLQVRSAHMWNISQHLTHHVRRD